MEAASTDTKVVLLRTAIASGNARAIAKLCDASPWLRKTSTYRKACKTVSKRTRLALKRATFYYMNVRAWDSEPTVTLQQPTRPMIVSYGGDFVPPLEQQVRNNSFAARTTGHVQAKVRFKTKNGTSYSTVVDNAWGRIYRVSEGTAPFCACDRHAPGACESCAMTAMEQKRFDEVLGLLAFADVKPDQVCSVRQLVKCHRVHNTVRYAFCLKFPGGVSGGEAWECVSDSPAPVLTSRNYTRSPHVLPCYRNALVEATVLHLPSVTSKKPEGHAIQ